MVVEPTGGRKRRRRDDRPPARHPLFARVYTSVAAAAERGGLAQHRERLLTGLSGRVIEVGAGHGLNFGHYPSSVEEVLAVEPEPYLRTRAAERARRAAVRIHVVDGVAEQLPAPDDTFDAAVASLVLCSVRDQGQALAELRRVLRTGGELRFYEHVRSRDPRLKRLQHLADRTLWPAVAGGCHTSRDTLVGVAEAGFRVEEVDQFEFRPCALAFLTAPHVLGRARTP